jgi:hypothetical protein
MKKEERRQETEGRNSVFRLQSYPRAPDITQKTTAAPTAIR